MVEELMERVATVEKEKAALASQYEKYATISDEVGSYKKRMNELSQAVEEKEKALEKERADKASIEHSQDELLKKMKDLQKDNDQLVVRLEGLKTENEGLITKNRKLEDRIKTLEGQNKQQLQQINETLKMPVPVIIEQEQLRAEVLKDVEDIENIREKVTAALEHQQQSARLSTSPPSLLVPSVIYGDEKRPSTTDRDLKVIPKIVEPLTASEVSIKGKEHGNTSTINSQDAPTIPNDSPVQRNSKYFADTFSRSGETLCALISNLNWTFCRLVSKDPPSVDDDFDPNTFDIDQVSDAEGVSELIEDEEDYEYLFNSDNF